MSGGGWGWGRCKVCIACVVWEAFDRYGCKLKVDGAAIGCSKKWGVLSSLVSNIFGDLIFENKVGEAFLLQFPAQYIRDQGVL